MVEKQGFKQPVKKVNPSSNITGTKCLLISLSLCDNIVQALESHKMKLFNYWDAKMFPLQTLA